MKHSSRRSHAPCFRSNGLSNGEGWSVSCRIGRSAVVRTPEAGPLHTWCRRAACPGRERDDRRGALFGRLYVLEGSRLGGKLLVKRAAESDDPQVRAATHYLGHGAESDFWRGFLERLESSAAVKGSPQRTLLGAREAFGLFVRDPAHV